MKSKSTAKAKSKQVIKESAGDCVFWNIWFKIGLSKSEAAMLKTIGQQIFDKKISSSEVARHLLITALAHYDKIEPLIIQDSKYAELEGFMLSVYRRGCVKNQHATLLKPVKGVRK